MKRRVLSFLTALVFCMSLVSLPANAENEALMFTDFEGDHSPWLGFTPSRRSAYNGEFGALVENPIGGPTSYGFANLLEYDDSVYLEAERMYTISFWARSDAFSPAGFSNTINQSGSTLVFEVFGLSHDWEQLELVFTPAESRNYGLDFLFYTDEEAPVIMVDDISLTETDLYPAEYRLAGRRSISIPYMGSVDYRYRLDAYDDWGDRMSAPLASYEAAALPEGVSFQPTSGTLTVSDAAEDGASFSLIAFVGGAPVAEIPIRLTKSLIPNGDFEEESLGWDADASPFTIEGNGSDNHFIRLESTSGDAEDSVASLKPENPVALRGGELYVLRATVHTTDEVPYSYLYTQNNSSGDETSIHIEINGLSGSEWSDIFCSIRPNNDGIYELTFDFHTQNFQPVFVDDLTLTHEELGVSEIYLSAPGHITRPVDSAAYFPMAVFTADQEGNETEADLTYSVTPDDGGLEVDASAMRLLVTPDASLGIYTLTAESGNISRSVDIMISDDYVGDGSFETTQVGQWWAAQEPADFSLILGTGGASPYDGNRMASLTLNGEMAAVITNAYAYYSPEKTYVFHSRIRKGYTDIDLSVTALLSDTDGNYTLIASDTIEGEDWAEVSGIFSPVEETVGKLVLFFSTDSTQYDQWVLFDALSVAPLCVTAEDVYLTGAFMPGSVATAHYTFSANFTTEDASLVRWHMAEKEDGPYTPIGNQDTLLLPDSMNDVYIKAEIIPISLLGGFVGESVWSDAQYVSAFSTPQDDDPDATPPPATPIINERLIAIPLPQTESGGLFTDTKEHWAYPQIAQMEAAGIATGYGDNTFRPDAPITRAEFTALIIRSFGLTPMRYSGGFLDISSDDWYAGIIETAYRYGLINGTDATHFSPDTLITREQMALIVMRAYHGADGAPPTGEAISFYDQYELSPEGMTSVMEATQLGIIKGMGEHLFAPHDNASRAQAIVMLSRLITALNQ